MKSIHFKCEREGITLRGLTSVVSFTNRHRSCCWDITAQEAKELIGGWIYLHNTKNETSVFGGKIIDYEETVLEEKVHSRRIALIFEARVQGRNQKWRGKDHIMAWTSGLIPSNYQHES